MNNFIQIKDRKIGLDYPPVVIVELGINHGGSLKTAFEMVDAAKEAGAEIIKHQTHIAEDEMSKHAKKIIPHNCDKSIYDIINECSLSEEDEIKLKKYVESKKMIFISTPFSRKAVDRLEKMNVPAYKIGSGECNNYALIEYIASFRKPVILSTGMNNIKNISKSVNILRKNNIPFALLHCTSVYPTPPELVRLNAMIELKLKFQDAVIGLSDHTLTNYPCLGAIALGASIIERHFTDHKKRKGPDIMCSMDKKELRELIKGSNILYKCRNGNKNILKEEQPTIDFAYASVITIKNIKKGDIFTKENLWVKRPGTGEIKSEKFKNILGKRSKFNLENDIQLKWSDII